jgi:hypothetical protein
MIEFLVYMFVFALGFFVGVGSFLGWGIYQLHKMRKAKKALAEEVAKKSVEIDQKTNSIKDRLIKAARIAQTQMELRAQAEMPSKNGLHSKYKNGLMSEIGELEQEKLDILKTILDDGFNPLITVLGDTGAKEEIPLSEYVSSAQETMDIALGKKDEKPQAPAAPTLADDQPRKVGKFFVYRGGKDDDTTH